MRNRAHTILVLALIGGSAVSHAGQLAPGAGKAQESDVSTSALLQPSLDVLEKAVSSLRLEKWKGGSVRTEASANVASILRDLQATLPPLLKDSDATPGSMSKLLPVSRNVDALYAVVLRVFDGASIAASADQVGQLQAAMSGLNKSRHALDDRMQDLAASQEKQVEDLQVALKTQPVPDCPVAAAPEPPPVPKKKVVKKKPKPAATTAPATTQSNGTGNAAGKPNQ